MTPLEQILARLPPGVRVQPHPNNVSDGIMIALTVPLADAQELAVPDGLPANTLHVTLAYLGKTGDLTDADVPHHAAFLGALATYARQGASFTATLTHAGRFPAAEKEPVWLGVDGAEVRQLHEAVKLAGTFFSVPVSDRHAFTPHVTLDYVEKDAPHPRADFEPRSVTFGSLDAYYGGTRVVLPLGDEVAKAEAPTSPTPAPHDPRATARDLLARLTVDQLAVRAGERHARAALERARAHHAHTFDGLGAAVRGPRGSALEDAALAHAEEARAARDLAAT